MAVQPAQRRAMPRANPTGEERLAALVAVADHGGDLLKLGVGESAELDEGGLVHELRVGETRPRFNRRFSDFCLLVLVLHRALPDLQRMKLCYSAAASSASRSVFSWCD